MKSIPWGFVCIGIALGWVLSWALRPSPVADVKIHLSAGKMLTNAEYDWIAKKMAAEKKSAARREEFRAFVPGIEGGLK